MGNVDYGYCCAVFGEIQASKTLPASLQIDRFTLEEGTVFREVLLGDWKILNEGCIKY